jgi:hypothetical protein
MHRSLVLLLANIYDSPSPPVVQQLVDAAGCHHKGHVLLKLLAVAVDAAQHLQWRRGRKQSKGSVRNLHSTFSLHEPMHIM